MTDKAKYIVGTSGYSFADWVGAFYPPGTRPQDMFAQYASRFQAVELNFSFYRLPTAETLDRIAARAPRDFTFWIKANRKTTHEQDRSVAGQFLEALDGLSARGQLAGVLMQFPQSFHRTAAGRQYLAEAIEDFSSVPLAVEFRHASWQDEAVLAGLRDRGVTLVVPDVPDLPGLFRPAAPAVTTATGYLRLHSRNADNWYAGAAERYDYDYDSEQLGEIVSTWSALEDQVDKVFVFFNNCHGGQAARNAEAFRRIVGQI